MRDMKCAYQSARKNELVVACDLQPLQGIKGGVNAAVDVIIPDRLQQMQRQLTRMSYFQFAKSQGPAASEHNCEQMV
jgi:hypothetical protein